MAAPSLGKRAGTMHVRVLPNTKHFPRELKQQLNRIEKSMPPLTVQVAKANVHTEKIRRSIQAQLASIRDLHVDVLADVDSRDALRQLGKLSDDRTVSLLPEIDRAMLERVTKQIGKSVRTIEATLRPTFDDEAVRSHVNDLTNELKRLEKHISINVLSDDEMLAARYRMNEIDESLQELAKDRTIKVELDRLNEQAIHHRIREISESLDDMAKDRTVHVDVNPFTSWASARLAWLTRPRMVEIIPKVSKAALAKAVTMLAALSGARLSYDYLDRFVNWMSEVDKKLPRLTFSALGLTTAFSGLMGAVSGIVGIGDGLAALLPSLLVVPGMLANAAISVVTLVIAMQDAGVHLESIKNDWANLGHVIRDNYWAEAAAPIIKFSNSVMPQLERSFEKTAIAMGRFTGKLANSFRKEFAGGRLEAMFDGLVSTWDELSKGTDAFAGAITNLGLVGAKYMPQLTKWFVRQANTFDNWLSDVSTDGRLDDWMKESVKSFYALWDVTAATTGIFQGLWKAAEAAGSGGLRGFADMLLAWETAVNGAQWQTTLTAMFRGAGVAMDGFGAGLARVGDMLYRQSDVIEYFMGTAGVALGDFIGDIADALSKPEVAEGLRKFVDGVAEGLDGLSPALEPMAEAFGKLAGFVGDLAAALGPTLNEALTTASELVVGLLDSFEDSGVVETLSTAFTSFLEDVEPTLKLLADTVGEDLVPALTKLADEGLPALSGLVEILGPVAAGSIEEFAGAVDGLATSLGGLNDIFGLFTGETDSKNMTPAWWAELADGLFKAGSALSPVVGIFEDLGLNIESVSEGLFNFGKTAGEKMTEFQLAVSIGIANAITWFASLPARISALFATAGTWLVERGAEILNGFQRGFNTGWLNAVIWFLGLPARVTAFFAGAGTWLYSSGASLLQGFADGVNSKIEEVKGAVAAGLAVIRALFPNSPAKEGPFSGRGWVSYSGVSVGETFGDSLVGALDKSRSKVSRSMAGIRKDFDSLSGDVGRTSFDVSSQFKSDRDYSARLTGRLASSSNGSAGSSTSTNVTANFIQPEQREQFREFTAVLERELR